MWIVTIASCALVAACASDSPGGTGGKTAQAAPVDAPPPEEPPPTEVEPVTAPPVYPVLDRSAEPYQAPRERGRMVELTLRSTPPGAEAAIDGRLIGPTPTYWRGPLTGQPREFTFVMPDYAMARYRFVPTTNGVVHATLLPLMNGEADAGP